MVAYCPFVAHFLFLLTICDPRFASLHFRKQSVSSFFRMIQLVLAKMWELQMPLRSEPDLAFLPRVHLPGLDQLLPK